MKFTNLAIVGLLGYTAAAPAAMSTPTPPSGSIQGFDISHYQGTVNFAGAKSSGAQFVIIKATEGTNVIDSGFQSHYSGASAAGLIRGGYHFARPNEGAGGAQATYFIAHGGGWSNDGMTLPGMIDLEAPPGAAACYGLSTTAMVAWIQDFVNTYHGSTGRYPIIYTSNSWWTQCTGNSNAFAATCPLNVARYSTSVGTIPGGWGRQTIWQNADTYTYGGDSDKFNGDSTALTALATG